MFKNPFKKSPKNPPEAESKPVSILDALGVTPYRTPEVKKPLPAKNKIRKPYKLPAITYAMIAFISCLMAGIASDAIHHYVPQATAAPTAFAMAFMFLAFFCGSQASQKWKH